MKAKCLLVTLCVLLATTCFADDIFPVAAIIGWDQTNNVLLDTMKAAGFNMAWTGGFDNSGDLLNKLAVLKQKGLKAVVHYPVLSGNPKYNTERFASGVHYFYHVATDSIFNKGSQYGYVDGNCWSSNNRGYVLYWDSVGAFNGRWWFKRTDTDNRTPANYASTAFNYDISNYKAVYHIKYRGTSHADSICKIRWVKRSESGAVDSIGGWRYLGAADFGMPNKFVPCTLSYFRTNGGSRWLDYEVYNCQDDTVSVDTIEIYDAVYDSLYRSLYNQNISDIAETYSDTSVVYRLYMQDEPVRSQLNAYYRVEQRLLASGNGVRGFTTVCQQYPTSFGNYGYSDWADTTFYSDFVTKTQPAQLMVDILPLFGDSGQICDAMPVDKTTIPYKYRTPVDSGFFLQTQFDIMSKYCHAADRACKLASPEIPFQVQLQCFGDSLADTIGGNLVTPGVEGRWRLPTPRELKCMAYLALSHGAKGLHYFLFSTGWSDYFVWNGIHQYWKSPAVVGDHGEVQHPDLYAAVKEINGRANIWATTLLNLTCDQTFRKQDGNIPIGTFITGVSDSLVQVGLFHYKTKINDKYFMLVNRHCLPTDTLIITVNISNARQFIVSDVFTGQIVTYAMPAGDNIPFRYTLQPGEGRLFHILQQ